MNKTIRKYIFLAMFFTMFHGFSLLGNAHEPKKVNIAILGSGIQEEKLTYGYPHPLESKNFSGNQHKMSGKTFETRILLGQDWRRAEDIRLFDLQVASKPSRAITPPIDSRKIDVNNVLKALDWIVDRNENLGHDEHRIHLAYLGMATSALSPSKMNELRGAVQEVVKSGTNVFVPAGDTSRDIHRRSSSVVPAAFPETITVGSFPGFTSGSKPVQLSSYSNYGEEMDFVGLSGEIDSTYHKAMAAAKAAADYINDWLFRHPEGHADSVHQIYWELQEQAKSLRIALPRNSGQANEIQILLNQRMDYHGNRVPDRFTIPGLDR